MPRLPELIVVERVGHIPNVGTYLLSFIELWPERIVVRFVGMEVGTSRALRSIGLTLCDDAGRGYEWKATTSGGMVLPDEVSVGFLGPLSHDADWVMLADERGVLHEQIRIPPRMAV